MSDCNDCRIFFTDFEKNIKHVIKIRPVLQKSFFSKTMMEEETDRHKIANIPFL